MENIEKNMDAVQIQSSVELRIAQAIADVKRTSERVIGITAIDYSFTKLSYKGTTVRPEPITPLERAVVGIIDIDGGVSFESLGAILGLDVAHDVAEKTMLSESIQKMQGYGIIEGDDTYLSLTEKGKIFASKGERPVTYEKAFDIYCDFKRPSYKYLTVDFSASRIMEKPISIETACFLDLSTIQQLAEIQAPSIQNEKNRYILQSASLISASSVNINVYVIFLQSIRNEGEFRVFVYDDSQNLILPHFSELIQSDKEWLSSLLDQCITSSLGKSVEDGGWTIVPDEQEKNDEQKNIEAELVQREDDEVEGKEVEGNELERLHKKALYDQVSFELELDKIFTQDKPDEVWIISPFVSWSFVKVRVKQFEPLLKQNKKIFIAYSEPYDKRPTISPEAYNAIMSEIERLDKTYMNFYWVELPKFHTKQVLEVKNGQCVLFNGSFNVLSFDNISVGRKVSREEMALVHHQIAISKHQEYVDTFSEIYRNRVLDKIRSCTEPKDVVNIKSTRIDFLHDISEVKESFVDFYTEYDEKMLQAKNSVWYDTCDGLLDDMNEAINEGGISLGKYKDISDTYSALMKDYVSITINSEVIKNLKEKYSAIDLLPRNDAPKKKKKNSIVSSDGEPTVDIAQRILDNPQFDSEKNVTIYVAALNYMFVNRKFKALTIGTKYLRNLIDNDNGFSYVSVFEYYKSKTGTSFNASVGVGGYKFSFYSIIPSNMEAKVQPLVKSMGKIRLDFVKNERIETILLKLISQ